MPFESFIEDAATSLRADERVLAAWLEGSLGAGRGDDYSDVDLHLAVADSEYAGFVAATEVVLGLFGTPLSWIDVPYPGAALIAATVLANSGPVRLDLLVEPRSRVATARRRKDVGGQRFLFDRDRVATDVAASPASTFDGAGYLSGLMRTFFFGALWPWRMEGRRDWTASLWNATAVLGQFVVPAMLIADGSPEFHRELTTRPRFLAPERREVLLGLQGHLLQAFQGVATDAPDVAAVRSFYAALFRVVFASFREAAEAVGVEYPAAAEQAYRDFYQQEWAEEVV